MCSIANFTDIFGMGWAVLRFFFLEILIKYVVEKGERK